jgi:hypothetical protein
VDAHERGMSRLFDDVHLRKKKMMCICGRTPEMQARRID